MVLRQMADMMCNIIDSKTLISPTMTRPRHGWREWKANYPPAWGGRYDTRRIFCYSNRNRKKLILLVSDGEPADIDVRDPQYLRYDTKKAVEELATKGVTTYCLTLDPNADDYVSRIFGVNRYAVVDHVQKLPEKLPALFVALTS
jgi:hypothetical protein